MRSKLTVSLLTALALGGCQTTTGAFTNVDAQPSPPNTRFFSYEGADVSLSWTATGATLNYDSALPMSNDEIVELVETETECRSQSVGAPSLIGSRVHLEVVISCAAPETDETDADTGEDASDGSEDAVS